MVYIEFDGYSASTIEFSELIVGALALVLDAQHDPFPSKLTDWPATLKTQS